ncbi:MAG: phosphopantetheine-binding protein [Spongiibacteraceae bacterium]
MTSDNAAPTRAEIKAMVLQQLLAVAPDLVGEEIDEHCNFRDQFDFDSMDQLHFVAALHERTGVEIPERDYPKLLNINGCIDYLRVRLA